MKKRIATMALILIAVVGCSSERTDMAGLLAAGSESAALAEMIPSGGELASKLGLSEAQGEQMEPPLSAWRGALTQEGDGEAVMGGRREAMLSFLEASAEILEPDQFVALLGLIAERRDAMAQALEGRGPRQGIGPGANERVGLRSRKGGAGFGRRGPGQARHGDPGRGGLGQGGVGRRGFGPGMGQGDLLEGLGLSEQQLAQIETQRETARAELREQMQSAELDRTARRELLVAHREAMKEFLEGVLTPEQLQQLEALREQRRGEHQEQAQERQGENMARQIGFLTNILELSQEQVTGLTTLLEEHHASWREAMANHREEGLDREELAELRQTSREELHGAIREILSEEQVVIFEALEPIVGRHGPRARRR